jgi:hypothetical protein
VAVFRAFAVAAATVFGLLAGTDVLVRTSFPHLDRFTGNFSEAYLDREMQTLAKDRAAIVFLGDSALWGYDVPPEDAAVSLLRRTGCDCRNLSFEGGSPANTYAMLRALLAAGAAPRAVVFNVNQKEFNPVDSAYRTLHPSVVGTAWPLLSPDERGLLASPTADSLNARLDRTVAAHWKLYGLRSDLREVMYGDVDAVHALNRGLQSVSGTSARRNAAHRPTAERFEGTYDLTPLSSSPDNVSLTFLRKTADLLAERHIRAFAVLTPTNHALLRAYIDSPAYDENLRSVTTLLERRGITVLDYDRSIPSAQFFDNDHLTAEGNRSFAALMSRAIRFP